MSKKDEVLAFWQNNQSMSIKDIALKMNMHYATVRHALKDKEVVSVKTTTSKIKTKKKHVAEDEVDLTTHVKQGEITSFCPKCGRATTARIGGATLVGTHYELSAYGNCKLCSIRWVMDGVGVRKEHV